LKERLATFALAIGALVLCYAFFLPKPSDESRFPPRPLSTELGPSGYQAAWRWLVAQRVPVAAARERYDSLISGDKSRSPTGNLLLTTLPHKLPVRPGEATQLDAWIESGNTLVVAAALDDTPVWALMGGERMIKDLGRLTRLKFDVIEPKKTDSKKPGAAPEVAAPEAAPDPVVPKSAAPKERTLSSALSELVEPRTIVIESRGAHPLLEGVHSVRVISDFPASRWRATPMDQSGVLQVAQVAGESDAAVWVRRQGKGQVIVFGVAGLFSNRDIGSGDNAKLLSNTIAWALRPGGAVIFDDAHQGAVSYYDAKAFFADPRLHRTMWWLVFLWLVFVLGIQRLRSHVNDWHSVDVTAFVGTTGQFFAATLTPLAVGGRLLGNFFNTIRRRLGWLEDGTPAWEWLSLQAEVTNRELAELRQFHEQIQSGRRINLLRLQNLLSQLQGKIT
jgi:Domain of unknown function (DUF4350)